MERECKKLLKKHLEPVLLSDGLPPIEDNIMISNINEVIKSREKENYKDSNTKNNNQVIQDIRIDDSQDLICDNSVQLIESNGYDCKKITNLGNIGNIGNNGNNGNKNNLSNTTNNNTNSSTNISTNNNSYNFNSNNTNINTNNGSKEHKDSSNSSNNNQGSSNQVPYKEKQILMDKLEYLTNDELVEVLTL